MKILIVSPRFPFRKGKADSMTVFHLIEYLYRSGHQVLLATFDNREQFDDSERQQLLDMCADSRVLPMKRYKKLLHVGLNLLSTDPFQVAYYRRTAMRRQVAELVKEHRPNILYAHLIRTAHYLKPYTSIPRVVGMQIAQTLNYSRLLEHERNFLRRLFYGAEYRRVKHYEPWVIEQFERILLISPRDKRAICPDRASEKIFFSPHGVDVSYYAEDLGRQRKSNVITMNGDFGVPTNIDGALYFYRKIFPEVRRVLPTVELWLVGRNPHPSIQRLEQTDPQVKVTGRVPDIRPYLQEATIGIAPIRAAAGLQNKVLVSLASRLPMVVTKIANEGIGAPVNKVLWEATDDQDFAMKVIKLLQEEDQRRRLGAQSLQFMEEFWTWDYHFQRLEEMLEELAKNHQATAKNYFPFATV